MKNRLSQPLIWILIGGFLLRVLFILKGGEIYYGKHDFWLMGGDTAGWMNSILNLINHGIYTSDMAVENAKFFRPPGYSFIMGIIYLLCGKNLALAYKVLIWLPVLFELVTIYLIYRIAWLGSFDKMISNLSALLYSTYPFIIVWVPVLYAESFSVFFMVAGIYFFIKQGSMNYFIAAVLTGFAALCRLQCLALLPVMLFVLMFRERKDLKILFKKATFFSVGIILSYGLWPLRNYIYHNRIVLTQDINIGGHWSDDYFSLMTFLFSSQVDVEPQWTQIMYRQKVEWPESSILDKSDRVLLDSLTKLCYDCGTGISYFRYYGGYNGELVPPDKNCDTLIKSGFDYLTAKQKEKNKFNYYVTVPAGNFKKAFFKSSLYGNKSTTVKILSTALFGYRTLLLVLGIAGLYICRKKKLFNKDILLLILLYSAGWYLFMCLSFRHLEMRYFLHADLLLLFPAAVYISWIRKKYFHRNKVMTTVAR